MPSPPLDVPLLLLHSCPFSHPLPAPSSSFRPFSWPGCEPRPVPIHHVGSSQMLLLPVQVQELLVCSRRHFLFFSVHFQTQCHSGCLPCSDLHTSDLGWWMPTFHWHWTGLDCKILCGVLVGWLGGSICGVLFESKFDIEMEIIESDIHFVYYRPPWKTCTQLTLAHHMANGSRPKKIFRFSFIWGFLFQNERFATCEKSDKYCGM